MPINKINDVQCTEIEKITSLSLSTIGKIGEGILSQFSATGGTVTYYDNYVIHTFTSSGTFEVSGEGTVEYLVVGGGGGGGGGNSNGTGGAGGGAGGMLTGSLSVSSNS